MSNLPEVPEFCILLIILISVSAIKELIVKKVKITKIDPKMTFKNNRFVDVEDLIK